MQVIYKSHSLNLSQKLRKLVWIVSVILAGVSVSLGCVAAGERLPAIKVATASNFLLPIQHLQSKFEQKTGYKIKIIAGSTAKLYAQIVNGAPYDVFLSADKISPQKLVEKNKALASDQFIYAQGRLVLWSTNKTFSDSEALTIAFKQGQFKRIALANPKTAPYGRAAIETLAYFNVKVPRNRQIMGESVGQTFQFVDSANVDMGFVAYSQLKSLSRQKGAYWLLPESSYSPIAQYGLILVNSRKNPAARAFVQYLTSPEVKALLKDKFGYL